MTRAIWATTIGSLPDILFYLISQFFGSVIFGSVQAASYGQPPPVSRCGARNG